MTTTFEDQCEALVDALSTKPVPVEPRPPETPSSLIPFPEIKPHEVEEAICSSRI